MKKAILFFVTLFFLLVSAGANSQTKPAVDFYAGQWKLLAGSPAGDMELIVILERKEGKFSGTVKVGDQDEVKFTKIEEKDLSLTLNFTSTHGYDIKMIMTKKDDDHIEGTLDTGMMGTFGVKGERIKEKN